MSKRRGSKESVVYSAVAMKDFKISEIPNTKVLEKSAKLHFEEFHLLTWITQNVIGFYKKNPSKFRKEFFSGITVAIMQVPESVAFSFVAGVPPLVGLYATVFMAIFTGLFGGRPGMISGAAGAMAVVLKDLTDPKGPLAHLSAAVRIEHLMMCVILVGVFQILCGFAQLAKLVKLIPQPAMLGFLNGLGIIIFMAQFSAFQNCPKYELFTMCAEEEVEWVSITEGNTWILLQHVFLCMFIMQFQPKIPNYEKCPLGKIINVCPASMTGILVGTFIEHVIVRPAGGKTRTIGETASINGGLPEPHWPDLGDKPEMGPVVTYAISLCFVGLIESVMTLQSVDEIVEDLPSTFRSNQECVAQGLGNLVSGLFFSMGGDAMIGQSTINAMNGARGRLSCVTSGIFMFLFIIALSDAIEFVPIGTLTGVLFMVVVNTFNWKSILTLKKVPMMDAVVIVVVTAVAVITNLAYAVVLGVCLVSIHNSWENGMAFDAKLYFAVDDEGAERKVYVLDSPLFFASVRNFIQMFDFQKDPMHVVVDFKNSRIDDYSGLNAINDAASHCKEHDTQLYIQNLDPASKALLERGGDLVEGVIFIEEGGPLTPFEKKNADAEHVKIEMTESEQTAKDTTL